MRKFVGLAALALLGTGCYHATVNTGLQPGTQVIHQQWAHGWIFGLVPPATVEAAKQCTGGVATVETQMSFLNGLVSNLTFGIYTPMDIKVTCAAARAELPSVKVQGDAQAAFAQALELARTTGAAQVRF
jgi:hypothetical protein